MNTLLILSALVAVSVAAPGVPYPYLTGAVSRQHHSQDELGQYNYGYFNPDSYKQEVRSFDGEVAGRYGYISPDGQRIDLAYTAGHNGFRAAGAHLPVPPAPTPEVVAATIDHDAAKAKAAIEAHAVPAPLAYAGHLPLAHSALPYGLPYAPAAYSSYAYGAPYAHNYYGYPGAVVRQW